MRFRGVHHVEFPVLDHDESIKFYDRMFGWLGYKSFWTFDLGYRSTYYMARFPFPHSYIGIQPARTGSRLNSHTHATGIHHIAPWARSRNEVDDFHESFLPRNAVEVTEPPAEYPTYTPGYYAVFFNDPITGIHWELSHTPPLPSPGSYMRWVKTLKSDFGQSLGRENWLSPRGASHSIFPQMCCERGDRIDEDAHAIAP